MERLKIVLIGAGSGFTATVVESLRDHESLQDCVLSLVDIDEERLQAAEQGVRAVAQDLNLNFEIQTTTVLEKALEGCNYVISACEINRNPYWVKDIEIPERHGVYQYLGENGGPGGQIHAMRNIGLFMPIISQMEKICPDAWLLNFTNPESMLLTYFLKYTKIKSAGFCHQVHGVMGVIAEQLGFEPGELQVISVGINHLNWLFDLRRRSTGRSYLEEFTRRISRSKYWRENHPEQRLPQQRFSLEVFKTFGMYPIGYDDHILEYMSFFYEPEEWAEMGFAHSMKAGLKQAIAQKRKSLETTMRHRHLLGETGKDAAPFPRNYADPYYREAPCAVINALETNELLYLDACVGFNHGAASNLPYDAIVDRPVAVIGGDLRSVHVGELPPGPAEICRRQIALHEMVVKATVEGDASLAVQALCLDPYVHSITQARAIWKDYYRAYKQHLFTFS